MDEIHSDTLRNSPNYDDQRPYIIASQHQAPKTESHSESNDDNTESFYEMQRLETAYFEEGFEVLSDEIDEDEGDSFHDGGVLSDGGEDQVNKTPIPDKNTLQEDNQTSHNIHCQPEEFASEVSQPKPLVEEHFEGTKPTSNSRDDNLTSSCEFEDSLEQEAERGNYYVDLPCNLAEPAPDIAMYVF